MGRLLIGGKPINIKWLETAEPDFVQNSVVENTLGGGWFVQDVGLYAKKRVVSVICDDTVRNNLLWWWAVKDVITVEYRGKTENGVIMTKPESTVVKQGKNALFRVSFEVAIDNV